MPTNEQLKVAVQLYTERPVARIERHDDSQVRGALVVRAHFDDAETLDLLLGGDRPTMGPKESGHDLADALEEVELSTWPPETGRLRFFV